MARALPISPSVFPVSLTSATISDVVSYAPQGNRRAIIDSISILADVDFLTANGEIQVTFAGRTLFSGSVASFLANQAGLDWIFNGPAKPDVKNDEKIVISAGASAGKLMVQIVGVEIPETGD